MLRIDVSPLKPGIHQFVMEPATEALDLDPGKFRDVRVEARLDVHERRILVLLEARATAQLECDRTLVLFDQEIEGRYNVLFATPELAPTEQEGYDEVRLMQPGEPSIDLTDAVRDTLLLALPQRCIAPGAEDVPIETVFGEPEEEEGIDPRWEALRRLRPPEDGPS